MPSLNELKEFKASFQHIGGQRATLAAKNIPFDDLELPTSEPQPLVASVEPEPAIDPVDDIDFSAFLGSGTPGDDLYAPEGLLSNLSDELDAIPPDFPEEPGSSEEGIDNAPPIDLDNLDNFVFSDEPLSADSGDKPLDLGSLDNFDMPEEPLAAADSGSAPLDLDSLDNFDMPEEPLAADSGSAPLDLDSLDNFDMPEEPLAAADSGSAPLDLDSLDNFDMPEEPLAADSGSAPLDLEGLDNFDLPEEPGSSQEELAADSGTPSFDLGNLDNFDMPEEPLAADSGSAPLDLEGLDSFDMPEEPGSSQEELAADSGAPSFDLGNLDNFDMPEEPLAADSGSAPLDLDNLDNFDMPEEPLAAADSGSAPLDLESLDNFDLPEEPGSSQEGLAADSDAPSFDLGNLDLPEEPGVSKETLAAVSGDESPIDDEGPIDFGDFDLPEEPTAAADESGNLDIDNLGDLDLPEELAAADESDNLGDSESPEPFDDMAPTDNYDDIDLGDLDDADFGDKQPDSTHAIDDFSFDELDDVLQKTQQKKEEVVAPAPTAKGKKWGRRGRKEARKARIEKAIEDVSEIELTDDEMEGLLETLSHYPLNLRIACEEAITEEIGSPKQMAELVEHLVWGASAKETAVLASRMLDRTIIVPKAFEKSSGAELEAEQASFAYIFVHRFLPVLRLFMFIAIVAASAFYLIHRFIYTPLKAESIYKIGYERISAGEYQRANERFDEASKIYRKKIWYYKYAEAFRDERQYIYAEQKYDELLQYYPRDKKGVLDYASLETNYLRNYEKADNILRWNLLDYAPNDREGLLAAGDNCLLWGDVEPARYEDARYYYARALEKYGWQAPVVERMMMYFIRTDNLREVIPLKVWFENNSKYELSAATMGELGGYLLDKQLEEVKGVPNEYVEHIGSVRDLLLKAVYADPTLPEPHYHLARYYKNLGSAHEELVSLRVANNAFDNAPEGSIRRLNYRIDALQRYADALVNTKEFFPAEEQLVKGINLYEDAVSRRLITPAPKYGKLYAGLGDLEYFTKTGDMEAALRFYHRSEQLGWAPSEMQYRMGAAYYQLENWRNALEYLFAASKNLPQNRRIMFALGNAALKRGDYFAANGYYNRLLDILESQRSRLPILLPNDRPEYLELAERLMMAQNNAGVANEMLSAQTGSRSYRARALAFYAEASRAWDARTRDPTSMIRSGSTPLPFLNSRNALYPQEGYEPQIFIRIDREALETSPWEELAGLARPELGR